jgi:hypothetical protein
MEYEIIRLPKGKSAVLGKIVQDDLVSRQTIAVRDTASVGLDGEDTIILIEGSEESLSKAKEILGEDGSLLDSKEKKDVYERIKEAEDNVAEGLGLMFG